MAKRQRGGARPGQRAPLQRGSHPATKPAVKPADAAPRPSGGLSDDELARAAELEARIVEEERTATSTVGRGRDRRRGGTAAAPVARTRAGGSITAVAEEEYRYVERDLRRIVIVFTAIFGLLIASWLIFGVSGLVTV